MMLFVGYLLIGLYLLFAIHFWLYVTDKLYYNIPNLERIGWGLVLVVVSAAWLSSATYLVVWFGAL